MDFLQGIRSFLDQLDISTPPRTGKLVSPAYEALRIPALYVHDLTGTEDADRLLKIAAGFSEKDNAVKGIPFKLVTASPTSESADIDAFVAISYSWHNEQWKVPARFSHAPKDWSFLVCPAMLKAMLGRMTHREAIWMDQLCIDQEDAVQKAQVVANMDTIYRNASRILILLEDLDINPDMEQVLELMAHSPSEPENDADRDRQRRSAFEENYAECVARGLTKSLFSFAKMVFTRCRWFQRAWCFHEYQLSAERTFVFVGHNRSCISLEQWFFYALFRETTAPKDYEVPDIFMHLVFARFTDGIGLNHPDEIEQHNLPLLFVELDSLLCFLLKDLISIALNTSGIFLGFDHDVASKADCQFVLGLILLAAGYPTALDLIGPCLHKRPAPCHQGVLR